MRKVVARSLVAFFCGAGIATAGGVVELEVPAVGERRVVRIRPDDGNKCVASFCFPIVDVQQLWTPDMTVPLVGRKWWISKCHCYCEW